MTKVLGLYSAVMLFTAVMLLWSAKTYVLGFLLLEAAVPFCLRYMLRQEVKKLNISLYSRAACVAGQGISIEIRFAGPRWIAVGILSGVMEVKNQLFQRSQAFPVAVSFSKRKHVLYIPYTPDGCGETVICLKEICCCDILGLNTLPAAAPKPLRITVFPEPLPFQVSAESFLSGFKEGEQQTVNRKGGDPSEVFELREYRTGDDVRSIHWKLSGKLDQLLVKESSDTSHYSTMILLDAGLFAGTDLCQEKLLSTAVSLALDFSEKLMRLGILHYIGMMAGQKPYFYQITELAEHTKTTEIWMGLTLEEVSGEGLQFFLAERIYQTCRHMIYITAGQFPEEIHMLPSDLSVTAICVVDDGTETQATSRGRGMFMEIPQSSLHSGIQTISI